MSDAPFPRDDRAWPLGAFVASLLCGVAALAGSAALVASAESFGRALDLMFVFVVLTGLQAVAYLDAIRPWLRGLPFPRRAVVIEGALVLLTFATFAGGADLGGAGVCGLLTGLFLPNASSIRYARVNRTLADDAQPELVQDPTDDSSVDDERPGRARPVPKVGPVLRETLAVDLDRCLAWAAASLTIAVACVAAGASGRQVLVVSALGLCALAWVSRRPFGVWLALRDFETAAFVPRRVYVVLLHEPNPRVPRPLLGVWSKEPLPSEGLLPRADAVYRCDVTQAALLSRQGGAVVHQAWLDTGPRARSQPRWVAADAGIALPQRRAVLGRWYLASVIGTERPARATPLSMPAPNPTREAETGTIANVISETKPGTGRWARMFAWRLASLVLVAGVIVWLR